MQNQFPQIKLSRQLVAIGILLALFVTVYQAQNWRLERAALGNAETILTNVLSDLETDHSLLDEAVQQVSSRLTSLRELIFMLSEPSTNQSHVGQLFALEANSYRHLDLFIPDSSSFDSVKDIATINDPNLASFIIIYYDLPGLPRRNTIGYNLLVAEWNQMRPDQQESDVLAQALLPNIELDELRYDREYQNLIAQTIEYLDNYEFRYLQFKNRNEHLQQMIRAKIQH